MFDIGKCDDSCRIGGEKGMMIGIARQHNTCVWKYLCFLADVDHK